MRILLRIIAIIVGVAVILTGIFIVQFASQGGLGALVRSGTLGLTTIAASAVILTVGPIATIQLWRLRRIGLFAAAMLFGIAFAYYVVGLLFLRAPEAPIKPIVGAIVVNGLLLCFLLSPAARRGVSLGTLVVFVSIVRLAAV